MPAAYLDDLLARRYGQAPHMLAGWPEDEYRAALDIMAAEGERRGG